MREFTKSYGVFLSDKRVKFVLYLLYPIVAIGICRVLVLFSDLYGFIHQGVAASIMIFAELLLDILVFGSILRKDTTKLDYLKLSDKGMEVLRKSLWVDKIRRFITVMIILCAAYMICHEGMNPWRLLSSIFTTGLVLELGLLVSRRFGTATTVGLLAWGLYIVGPVLTVVAACLPGYCLVAFGAAYIGVLFWSNIHIMKRARSVYYDSESEKEF